MDETSRMPSQPSSTNDVDLLLGKKTEFPGWQNNVSEQYVIPRQTGFVFCDMLSPHEMKQLSSVSGERDGHGGEPSTLNSWRTKV